MDSKEIGHVIHHVNTGAGLLQGLHPKPKVKSFLRFVQGTKLQSSLE